MNNLQQWQIEADMEDDADVPGEDIPVEGHEIEGRIVVKPM